MSTISAIDSFIDQYQKEKEKYERIRDNATAQLKSALHDAGIMEITTSRIKDIYRLRDKLNLRNEEKAYKSVADIKDDLADLIYLYQTLKKNATCWSTIQNVSAFRRWRSIYKTSKR